ncbi:hypothetical protein H0H87_001182 [Tephrocybe sp. NHM501043]|nr:hypothetical protein H0H87_001182 [Tephrocybe sp. NHM501043]
MADLVIPDPNVNVSLIQHVYSIARNPSSFQGMRYFSGPDGAQYRWRPSTKNHDIMLQDGTGAVIALFRPTRPTRYQIGDVYGELHFFRSAGTGTVVRVFLSDVYP